jgi:hypothetical protein
MFGRELGSAIQYIEKLSLHERFRLIEIAHETSNADIRKFALLLLEQWHASF